VIENRSRFFNTVKTSLILGIITFNSVLLNSYRYDYNLYLSLISAKLDPSLFKRDLFIQTLFKYDIGWFWKIAQLLSEYFSKEKSFFLLHIVILYFTIYSIYTLSFSLFKKPIGAYLSVILFSIGIRQWIVDAPQIYYFFVHHSSFSLSFLIFAINFFITGNYFLAFFLAGLAVNFQLMYAFFVLFFFLLYFLLNIKKIGLKTFSLSSLAFLIPASPGLISVFSNLGKINVGKEWYEVVKWTLWIHIYPSTWDFGMFRNFFIFLLAVTIAFRYFPSSREKEKVLISFLSVGLLCLAGTVFSEFKPLPTVMQLHLWRSTWIYFILAICIVSNFLVCSFKENIWGRFGVVGAGLVISSYVTTWFNSPRCYYETPYWLLPFFLLFIIISDSRIDLGRIRILFWMFICFVSALILGSTILSRFRDSFFDIRLGRLILFGACFLFLLVLMIIEKYLKIRDKKKFLVVISLAFALIFDFVVIYERGGFAIHLKGYDEKRIDPWVDIQLYAKNNTPKDSLFIVPPYKAYPDFRMFSERASFGDWIDGGLTIFFGNEYGKTWLTRMKDLGLSGKTYFDVGLLKEREEYNSISAERFLEVTKKYDTDYVVVEKPKKLSLPLVYENKNFIIYSLKNEL